MHRTFSFRVNFVNQWKNVFALSRFNFSSFLSKSSAAKPDQKVIFRQILMMFLCVNGILWSA